MTLVVVPKELKESDKLRTLESPTVIKSTSSNISEILCIVKSGTLGELSGKRVDLSGTEDEFMEEDELSGTCGNMPGTQGRLKVGIPTPEKRNFDLTTFE